MPWTFAPSPETKSSSPVSLDACHSRTPSLSSLRKGGRGLTTLESKDITTCTFLLCIYATEPFPSRLHCVISLLKLPHWSPVTADVQVQNTEPPRTGGALPFTLLPSLAPTLRPCSHATHLLGLEHAYNGGGCLLCFHCLTDSSSSFQTLIFCESFLTTPPGQVSPLFEDMAI